MRPCEKKPQPELKQGLAFINAKQLCKAPYSLADLLIQTNWMRYFHLFPMRVCVVQFSSSKCSASNSNKKKDVWMKHGNCSKPPQQIPGTDGEDFVKQKNALHYSGVKDRSFWASSIAPRARLAAELGGLKIGNTPDSVGHKQEPTVFVKMDEVNGPGPVPGLGMALFPTMIYLVQFSPEQTLVLGRVKMIQNSDL